MHQTARATFIGDFIKHPKWVGILGRRRERYKLSYRVRGKIWAFPFPRLPPSHPCISCHNYGKSMCNKRRKRQFAISSNTPDPTHILSSLSYRNAEKEEKKLRIYATYCCSPAVLISVTLVLHPVSCYCSLSWTTNFPHHPGYLS